MIIADTGFWLALANSNDDHHKIALQRFNEFKERETLITTWPVITETCHLLLQRQGVDSQIKFIQSYRDNGFAVFHLGNDYKQRLAELMKKYADLPMDLGDF